MAQQKTEYEERKERYHKVTLTPAQVAKQDSNKPIRDDAIKQYNQENRTDVRPRVTR